MAPAARERIRRGDFDRELSRLYVFLQSASVAVETGADATFAKRYDAWHEAARDPRMLLAIYWARTGVGGPTLAITVPATHTFARVPWPDALAPIEADLGPGRDAAGVALAAANSLPRDPVDASVPAIVVGVQSLPSKLIQSDRIVNTFVSLEVSPDVLISFLDRSYSAVDDPTGPGRTLLPDRGRRSRTGSRSSTFAALARR